MILFLILLFIGAGILEAFSLNTSFQNIQFQFRTESRAAEPGEPFYIEQKASNSGHIPVTFLKSRISFPKGVSYSVDRAAEMNRFERNSEVRFFLMPMRCVKKRTAVTLHERGLYWLENAELERGDFLGLKSEYSRVWGYSGIVVYPRKISDQRTQDTLSGIVGDLLSRPFLMRDPVIVSGIREYTGNEPMKTISWGQTARKSELMVRDFEYTRDRSCCMILYGSPDAIDSQLDCCAGLARTLGEKLIHQGVSVYFFTNAYLQGEMPHRIYSSKASTGSEDVFLDQLARLKPGVCAEGKRLLDAVMRQADRSVGYVMIVPKADENTKEFLTSLNALSGTKCIVLDASETEESV